MCFQASTPEEMTYQRLPLMTHFSYLFIHYHVWQFIQYIAQNIHYNDVIMSAVAFKSPASRLFIQLFFEAQIQENIPGLYTGNSPVTGEFPAQMASNAENVSIWWRLHVSIFKDVGISFLIFHFHNGLKHIWSAAAAKDNGMHFTFTSQNIHMSQCIYIYLIRWLCMDFLFIFE